MPGHGSALARKFRQGVTDIVLALWCQQQVRWTPMLLQVWQPYLIDIPPAGSRARQHLSMSRASIYQNQMQAVPFPHRASGYKVCSPKHSDLLVPVQLATGGQLLSLLQDQLDPCHRADKSMYVR